MKYYSPQSTENTVKCKKFANADMVSCIMQALPEAWQNDLLKSVQGNLPETIRELLPLLELIEKSPPTSAHKHESAKGKSENGDRAGKKHSMESVNDRIPCKKARFQPCVLSAPSMVENPTLTPQRSVTSGT